MTSTPSVYSYPLARWRRSLRLAQARRGERGRGPGARREPAGRPRRVVAGGSTPSTRQGRREDCGVGRHADDVPSGDALELAAGEQLAGKVVQPHRHALGGQLGKRVTGGCQWSCAGLPV